MQTSSRLGGARLISRYVCPPPPALRAQPPPAESKNTWYITAVTYRYTVQHLAITPSGRPAPPTVTDGAKELYVSSQFHVLLMIALDCLFVSVMSTPSLAVNASYYRSHKTVPTTHHSPNGQPWPATIPLGIVVTAPTEGPVCCRSLPATVRPTDDRRHRRPTAPPLAPLGPPGPLAFSCFCFPPPPCPT